MTGRLIIEPTNARLRPHTHLELLMSPSGDESIRFSDPRRFGGIWWLGSGPADAEMVPEPLTLALAAPSTAWQDDPRHQDVALLDQLLIAGLGNIYVDESLFLANPSAGALGDLTPEQVGPAQPRYQVDVEPAPPPWQHAA